jgi:hypothetical protein
VLEGLELGRRNRFVGAALDGQHALRWGGHEQRRVEGRNDLIEQAEPRQSRHGQYEGIYLAVG